MRRCSSGSTGRGRRRRRRPAARRRWRRPRGCWRGTCCPGPRRCWPPRPARRCRRTARWPAPRSSSCSSRPAGRGGRRAPWPPPRWGPWWRRRRARPARCPPDRALYSEDLPALGRPTNPKRSIGRAGYRRRGSPVRPPVPDPSAVRAPDSGPKRTGSAPTGSRYESRAWIRHVDMTDTPDGAAMTPSRPPWTGSATCSTGRWRRRRRSGPSATPPRCVDARPRRRARAAARRRHPAGAGRHRALAPARSSCRRSTARSRPAGRARGHHRPALGDEGRALPGGPPGRLPQPLHLERRRRPDRGHGPDGRWPWATSTWWSPTTRPASPSPTASTASGCEAQLDEIAGSTRSWPRSASSPASRSTSWRTAPSTTTTTCSTGLDVVVASVHSKLQMDRRGHDPAHGAGRGQPPRRHPRPLHRPQAAGHRGLRPRRRPRAWPGPSPPSTPTWCSRPAPSSTPRWRSTADPSARTRPTSCSPSPSSGAAGSPSTPTPTPRASSSGRPTAATRPPATASTPTGSSTPGRPTSLVDWAAGAPRPVASHPYVEEDREAQDQRPAQAGQPRHQAQRRSLSGRLVPPLPPPGADDLVEVRARGHRPRPVPVAGARR